MKTIGIVGSRRRDTKEDMQLLYGAFRAWYEPGDTIVSGGCPRGADNWAEELARLYGTTIIIHHADWSTHGKAAGPIRNKKIAHDADILIAVVAEDRKGGTESTIRFFKEASVTGKAQLIVI
jgi:hypothetical protein